MISAILILLVSCYFILCGWPIANLTGKTILVERLGLAFLLGNGLTTFIWFLLYLLGIPLDFLSLLISGSITYLMGFFINKRFELKSPILPLPKLSIYQKALNLIIIVLLIISFVIGSYKPLIAWDSIALYDFRGHTIALNHSLKDLTEDSYYVSYPLLISLDHAIIYMLKGVSAQGMHAIIFAAFIAVIYGRLASFSSLLYAGIGSLLIILNKEIFAHSTYAYTNLPYIAYLITSILYSVSPTRKNKQLSFLILAGILTGLSTWVRSLEAFWFIPTFLILLQGWYLRALPLSIFAAIIGYSIRTVWTRFFAHVLTQINYPQVPLLARLTPSTLEHIYTNIPVYYWYIYLNILYPYIGMWMMVIPVGIISWQKRDFRLFLFLVSFILTIAIVIAGTVFLSTYFPTWNEIGDSARRMILFIVPLSIIAGTYAASLVKKDHP